MKDSPSPPTVPSEVKTTVRGGVAVKITEETEYPFRAHREAVRVSRQTRDVSPWCSESPPGPQTAAITVNGTPVTGVKPGTFHRLERKWKPGDTVELRFPLEVRFSTWYRDAIAVERGPLVFSLKVGEEWRKVVNRPQAPDWAIYPTTPWNYGLLAQDVKVEDKPLGDYPFSPEGAPRGTEAEGPPDPRMEPLERLRRNATPKPGPIQPPPGRPDPDPLRLRQTKGNRLPQTSPLTYALVVPALAGARLQPRHRLTSSFRTRRGEFRIAG